METLHEKLRKLRRLTKSPNANEAAQAQRFYDRLSKKYGIDVSDEEAKVKIHEEAISCAEFTAMHRLAVVMVHAIIEQIQVARLRNTIIFLGDLPLCKRAAELFAKVMTIFEAEWKWFNEMEFLPDRNQIEIRVDCIWCHGIGCIVCGEKRLTIYKQAEESMKIKDMESFLAGLAAGMQERHFQDQIPQMNSFEEAAEHFLQCASEALVPIQNVAAVEDHMQEKYGSKFRTKVEVKITHRFSYDLGISRGLAIQLNPKTALPAHQNACL